MSGPGPSASETLELLERIGAELHHCLSCGGCRAHCPIHAATGRLQPIRLVQLANLGLIPELLRRPEVHYCLQCNSCSQFCPMTVRPAALIKALRKEAVRTGAISAETDRELNGLRAMLQRVRRRAIERLLQGQAVADVVADLDAMGQPSDEPPAAPEPLAAPFAGSELGKQVEQAIGYPPDLSSCMTCRECTTVCPVAHERLVYDPVTVFRRHQLGATDELLASPDIWLCRSCEACSEACRQGVTGHALIEGLQQVAIEQGAVPDGFRQLLRELDQALYPWFLERVHGVLGD
jgi:heterodisulfide reductase subunit C